MTIEELQNRIDQANKDSKNGKLTKSTQLISEIEEWN